MKKSELIKMIKEEMESTMTEHHLESREDQEQYVMEKMSELDDSAVEKIYNFVEKKLGVTTENSTAGVPARASKYAFSNKPNEK